MPPKKFDPEQLRAARELQEMFQSKKGEPTRGGPRQGGPRYPSGSSGLRSMNSGSTFPSSSTGQRPEMYRPSRGHREKVFEFNSKSPAAVTVDPDIVAWLKPQKKNDRNVADNATAKGEVLTRPTGPSKQVISGPPGPSKGNTAKENVEPGSAIAQQGMSGHPGGSKNTTAKVAALNQPKQTGPKPLAVVKHSGIVQPQASMPNQRKQTEPRPLEVIKSGGIIKPQDHGLSNGINKAANQTGPLPVESTAGQSSVTGPAPSIASGRINDNGSSFLNSNGGQGFERNPGDASRLRLTVVDRYTLIKHGWSAPPSAPGAPSLGLHKSQKSTLATEDSSFEADGMSEVSYAMLNRATERVAAEREHSFDAEIAPVSLQEPLIPAVESRLHDQVDLIEFPPEEGTLITVGTVNRGAQECLCKNPKGIKHTKGLSSSRWASPGYEHKGALPSSSATVVHEAGCPMRANWAKQRFLESRAAPAALGGREVEAAVTSPVQKSKRFDASAPPFQPIRRC